MSVSSDLAKMQIGSTFLAFRPSQTYTTAVGAYTLFTIAVGSVELITLGGRITAAADGAEQVTLAIGAIGLDVGATAINGAVGTVVWIPLNAAGTLLNVVALPKTIATGAPSMIAGTVAGPIVATFSVGVSATMEWFCVWRKQAPNARVY